MQRVRPLTGLGLLLVGELAALAFLIRMRASDWVASPGDILTATPESALYGIAWVTAATLTGWLTLTTVASIIAYTSRIAPAIRAVEWITIPPIRRLAQRATALSMVAASLTAPVASLASEPPPIPVVVVLDEPTAVSLPVESPGPSLEVANPAPRPGVRESSAEYVSPSTTLPQATSVDVEPDGPRRYTVMPGDNMWTITAAYLADELDTRPTNAQIGAVWRTVMDLNRNSIRSGNVDLIFPGEQLILPPVSVGG